MLIGAGVLTNLAGLGTSLKRKTKLIKNKPAKIEVMEIMRERRVLIHFW